MKFQDFFCGNSNGKIDELDKNDNKLYAAVGHMIK